ncbi:MAG: hypothetical protein ABI647_24945 [Gemmatimonadota bacterium]
MIDARWLLCVVLVTACQQQRAPASPPGTHDSAGVEIVETSTPAWDSTSAWTVEAEPFLSIGEAEGDDPYLFSRIEGAIRRNDGSIVVADGGAREFREFDSTGQFLAAKGRRGPGPAEFGSIHGVARCGTKEIWVDAGSRISIWSVDLKYLHEFKVPDNVMWPLVCFGGSGLLVKRDLGGDREPPRNTIYFDSLHLMVRDSMGESRHDLMDIPLWAYMNVSKDRSVYGILHPLGRTTLLASDGQNLVIGYAERLELNTYSRAGVLLRIARGPSEDLTLNSAWRRDFERAELVGREKEARELVKIAGDPMPATVPAYSALKVDRDGNMWVRRFELAGHTTNRWGVFGRDGRFLGHVAVPARLEILEIGPGYILGGETDSLYVQRIRAYRLHR